MTQSHLAYRMRLAKPADINVLVAFTMQEALEAEGTRTTEAAVRRGIEAAFSTPPRAVYWVVETPDGQIAGSASTVTEWSDFHGGDYWWIQSVFVVPEHRGSGVVDLVVEQLASAARAAGALDLRLYAHRSNERALRAYQRCGFVVAPYVIMSRPLRNDLRGNGDGQET